MTNASSLESRCMYTSANAVTLQATTAQAATMTAPNFVDSVARFVLTLTKTQPEAAGYTAEPLYPLPI